MTLNHHRRFSARLAFTLNNPIRRFLSPPEQLISKLDVGPNDVAVDFGCGPGFFTVPLAKVAGKVIGVDVSPRMLERAASYARRNKLTVEFVRSDGTDVRLGDDSVDMILLNHVFHEIEDRPRVLSEFLRIMRPSGRLVIVERTRGRSWNEQDSLSFERSLTEKIPLSSLGKWPQSSLIEVLGCF